MTTATLALRSPIEQMEIEESLSLSKSPRTLLGKVNTALESIRTAVDFPKRSKGKLSSISITPALGKVKLFFDATKQRISSIQIFRKPAEVSIEMKDVTGSLEASSATELSLIRRTQNAADAAFTKIEEKVDALETPLEFAEIGLEWAALTETLEHHAEAIAEGLGKIAAPLKLVTLIAKMKKVHKTFFGPTVEGAEPTKPSDVVSMAFSLVGSLCGVFSWLQKIGILTPAVAIAGRLSLISGLCSIVVTIVDLVDNVKNFSTSMKLFKAILNFVVAVVTVVLILYALEHLKLLLLILGTGILILNVATSNKEPEKVKAS